MPGFTKLLASTVPSGFGSNACGAFSARTPSSAAASEGRWDEGGIGAVALERVLEDRHARGIDREPAVLGAPHDLLRDHDDRVMEVGLREGVHHHLVPKLAASTASR
jgi:hypothetical protein